LKLYFPGFCLPAKKNRPKLFSCDNSGLVHKISFYVRRFDIVSSDDGKQQQQQDLQQQQQDLQQQQQDLQQQQQQQDLLQHQRQQAK
jgi:hypothetical protein